MGSNANDKSTDAFILVIDDSPTQADYLRLILERNDFIVGTAGNGSQALAMLEEREPEIIITDVLMPDMDGFGLCSKIKKDERFKDIPVIILTSLSDPHDVIKGLECGADNFVTKPCDEKFLISRINYLKTERHKPRCISMPKFMEFSIDGHEYQISSDRRQILNLFLSTYEAAYHKNLELRKAKDELRELNARLEASNRELEAANQELESFGHTVSHDLKQPLQIISGYSQALTQICGEILDAECKTYLKEITNRTFKMSELITTLLNFSRLGHAKMRSEAIDLTVMAQLIAAELRITAPKRKVSFRIQEGLKATGDKKLIHLVLQNLIENAWKYSSKREEAVIEFGAAEVDGDQTFFVRDNGEGFEMQDQDKLFTPFKRLSTEHEGHGIGLATVQRIIKRHNGKIWAEGEPGMGATFYFTL